MSELIKKLASFQNVEEFREQHWVGAFEDYLQIVKKNPAVTRNAYQRVYDMILCYGREEYVDTKKKLVHYPFFDDPDGDGVDGGRSIGDHRADADHRAHALSIEGLGAAGDPLAIEQGPVEARPTPSVCVIYGPREARAVRVIVGVFETDDAALHRGAPVRW